MDPRSMAERYADENLAYGMEDGDEPTAVRKHDEVTVVEEGQLGPWGPGPAVQCECGACWRITDETSITDALSAWSRHSFIAVAWAAYVSADRIRDRRLRDKYVAYAELADD